MMGGIVTRNMQSKAIAKNKRNCCILLDLFHYEEANGRFPQFYERAQKHR